MSKTFVFATDSHTRGISSNGRALALHARGTGIDTRILHYGVRASPFIKLSAACMLGICNEEFQSVDILGSIVVSIPACHAGDQGSIPCRGGMTFHS